MMSEKEARELENVIGCRIRTLRKAAGLSQEELAERADIAPQFLSRLENARHVPSVQTMLRLARALGTTPSALLGEPCRDSQAERMKRVAAMFEMLTEEDAEFLESQLAGWTSRLRKRR